MLFTYDIQMIYFSSGKEQRKNYYNSQKTSTKKHPSIKFNFKHSKIEIEFPDPKIYKNTNGKRCLAIYRKPTYRQNYLNFKSAHPPSLKKMIPCSRRRRISGICTETNEVTKRLTELKEAFLIRGYQKRSIDYQFNRLNHQKHQTKKKIPLVLTYYQTLPNFSKIPSDN